MFISYIATYTYCFLTSIIPARYLYNYNYRINQKLSTLYWYTYTYVAITTCFHSCTNVRHYLIRIT